AGADTQVLREPLGAGEACGQVAVGRLGGGPVECAYGLGDGSVDLVPANEGDRQEIGHLLCVETVADSTAEDVDDLLGGRAKALGEHRRVHAKSVLLFARESNPGC